MIPFFELDMIKFGPLTIQVWGLLVASGIVAAVFYMLRQARKYFLSEEFLLDATIWILISSFLFARVFHVLFYNWDFYRMHPSEIIKFWHGGLSSTGGFFGAFLAFSLFVYFRRFKVKELLPYFDVMASSLWLGWGIGRIGCFITHMHPGRLTSFFLSVQFPFGQRFDLGLLESILGFALFGTFAYLFKPLIKIRWGLVAAYSFLAYAIGRFFLDFLRASDLPMSDARYDHLTPAQWAVLVVIIALTALLVSGRMKRPSTKNTGHGEIA